MVHAFRRDLGDGFGQFKHRRVGGHEKQVVVRQFAHLLAGRFGQLVTAIADGNTPQAGHAVENLVAFAVPQVHALGVSDDAWADFFQLFEVTERCQVVIVAQLLPFEGLRVLVGHTALL